MAIYDSNGNEISKVTKKPHITELGGTGRSHSQRFQFNLSTDEYLSTLQFPSDIEIYNKMARSDGQVKAILLMLSLPIRSTQWFLRPKDNSSQAKIISDYVESCLLSQSGEGLQLGFDEFIKDVTTMFQYGHAVFEKVFEIKKGKIKWKKFAVRPQSTIYEIYYDRVGDFKGIDQYMIHDNWETQYIPIEKLLFFSHDMEQGNIRGSSVLRSAYKHWYIKDFLYKLVNIGIERNFVGTPVLTLPENYTQDDKELADEIVVTLRSSEFGGVRLPDGFVLEMFEGKRTLTDVLPYINHQDDLMTKCILAQFMNLGTGGTSGSFALSSDQSRLFLMMLDSAAKNISNIVNTHAIPELVKYNFDSDLYPTLAFKSMNSAVIINTLKTLVDGKIIVPDDDLEKYIRDMLDLHDSNPAQSRSEIVEQFKQNQLEKSSDESPDNPTEKTKSKTPIENNSKQKQYTDKIKEDKVNKMTESIFTDLSDNQTELLTDVISRQLYKLNEKAEITDINNLATIKVQYKGELTRIIGNILKENICLNETDIKYIARSNIISNELSELVKSMFLNEFIDNNEINFIELTNQIMNKI